jgi:hypothetical protein
MELLRTDIPGTSTLIVTNVKNKTKSMTQSTLNVLQPVSQIK